MLSLGILIPSRDVEISISPSSLFFTPSNWDTPQTVTVTGIDDEIIDGIKVTYITVAVVDALSSDEAKKIFADSFPKIITVSRLEKRKGIYSECIY